MVAKNSKPEVSIVVPVHNGINFLPQFWKNIKTSISKNFELIVVDDGSTENIKETIPNDLKKKNFLFYRNEFPEGYANAVNFGVSKAQGKYYFILNTDLILQKDSLNSMIKTLGDTKDCGIIGSKLIYPQTGRIQHIGVGFSDIKKYHFFLNSPYSNSLVNKNREVQATTFAQVCIPSKVWQATGNLNPFYFNRNEDIDYCLRVRKNGLKIIVDSQSISYHWESLSGTPRFSLDESNEARFWTDWGNKIEQDMLKYLLESWKNQFQSEKKIEINNWAIINLSRGLLDKGIISFIKQKLKSTGNLKVFNFRQTSNPNYQLYLPLILPLNFLSESKRFFYVVDQFPQLDKNKYWFNCRLNLLDNEYVIDHFANIIKTSDLCLNT